MILTSLLAFTPLALAGPASIAVPSNVAGPRAATTLQDAPSSGPFVLKARRVEIGDGEVMEHAVMLIEDGKILVMGQDLPVERGLPVIELDDDQVVMPGIVNPYSRHGMSGGGFNDSRPNIMASDELYPTPRYDAFLENGITTVAQYPAGTGIPGQAVALNTFAGTKSSMLIEDGVYLKVIMSNNARYKRNLTDGFEKADEYLKEVEEKRKEFEEKKDKEKDKDKKKEMEFEEPQVDPRVQPFFDLREGKLQALFSIDSAAAYDHLVDAIGDEEFEWHLRIPLSRDIDVFHVKDKIGEKGVFCLMEPEITLMPGTMRQRNLPAEFARAGAKLVLVPRRDNPAGFESFLGDVGVMIATGLDRAAAVRAMSKNAADFLGLGDRLGTLEEGKHANLVVFSGDPFEPGTKIDAVMLGGNFVIGDVNQ